MMHHYVYETYSEVDGRRYIGCRSCKCDPIQDPYMGSFKDRTYQPTKKTILQTFETREDALAYEVYLHDLYDVARNPEFANRAKQKTTGFCTQGTLGPNFGKTLSNETRERLSLSVLGSKWWTDGKRDRLCKVCPGPDWRLGRHDWSEKQRNRPKEVREKIARSNQGKKWWNNGLKETKSEQCPEGWKRGRLSKSKELTEKIALALKGKTWWNNGEKETKSAVSPGESWTKGRLRRV